MDATVATRQEPSPGWAFSAAMAAASADAWALGAVDAERQGLPLAVPSLPVDAVGPGDPVELGAPVEAVADEGRGLA